MFLRTIAEHEATGRVAEIYAQQKADLGFVMAAMQCWTTREDLLPLYMDFTAKVRGGFSLTQREWRLITLIAAKHIPSSYCSHVYSMQLIDDLGSESAVLAVQRDFHNAGLSDLDVAMLGYAEKIARNASEVTAVDIAHLRDVGFSDRQICDIALCAAWRCFVSRFFDAVGAGAESAFLSEDPEFRAAMNVGRKAES